MVCHAVVVEAEQRLILIDSGLGIQDLKRRGSRLPWLMRSILRPELALEQTAMFQIQKLGYAAEDVTDIVLTHLDIDHAGGISDFPNATVHVSRKEWDEAMSGSNPRYQVEQFDHVDTDSLKLIDTLEETWFGLPASAVLPELPVTIRLVDLPGHTLGHCGVALETDSGWLFHAGDSYYHRADIDSDDQGKVPAGLRAFAALAADDRPKAKQSLAHVRMLQRRHGDEVSIFSSHDPLELRHLRGAR
jgi:glyoxylase-like metal-dependent hydrolase (beta-lactamase superfamily II)